MRLLLKAITSGPRFVAGAAARVVPGGPEALPYIIAPMGVTAVLLFAVPASPLAQPWSVVGHGGHRRAGCLRG